MIIPRPLKKVLGKIIPFSQEDKVPTFNLGSGTADSTTYLRGDGTWSTVTGTAANKMYTVGRNSTGSTLFKGTIVYISGSTGNRPNFVKAQANSEATSAGTFGVIEEDIPNNSDGNCVTIGTLDDLDTRTVATHPFTDVTLADGDTIYLHPTVAGYVTNVKPSAPNHLVYVGKVVRTHPTLGTIVYRIQNGYEIDELHDVAIASPTNGQILQYESATSLWKNVTPSSGGLTVGTTAIASGTNSRLLFQSGGVLSQSSKLTFDGSLFKLIGTDYITTNNVFNIRTYTDDRNLIKVNGLGKTDWGFDTAGLDMITIEPQQARIEQTAYGGLKIMSLSASEGYIGHGVGAYKFGIGANSPQARLDVRAQGALSTDLAFRVRNSANSQNLLSIAGDGRIAIGLNAQFLGTTDAFKNVVIGGGAKDISVAGVSENSVAVGYNAISNNGGTAIGANTTIIGSSGVAVGASAYAGIDSTAIGAGARADATSLYQSLAIGKGARASALLSGIIAVGQSSYTNALSQTLAFCVDPSGANSQTMLLTNKANLVFRNSTQLTAGTHWNTTATNTLTIHNGTITTGNIVDAAQFYVTDIVAGNAAPHFRTEAGDIIKLYKETTAVTASTLVSNLGMPLTDTDTFDGYTLKQVVKALRNLGILA